MVKKCCSLRGKGRETLFSPSFVLGAPSWRRCCSTIVLNFVSPPDTECCLKDAQFHRILSTWPLRMTTIVNRRGYSKVLSSLSVLLWCGQVVYYRLWAEWRVVDKLSIPIWRGPSHKRSATLNTEPPTSWARSFLFKRFVEEKRNVEFFHFMSSVIH